MTMRLQVSWWRHLRLVAEGSSRGAVARRCANERALRGLCTGANLRCPASMKTRIKRLASLAVAGFSFLMHSAAADAPIALVVHGGAGIAREELTPERETACRTTLEESLRAGEKILRDGGTSLDAVEAAIVVL